MSNIKDCLDTKPKILKYNQKISAIKSIPISAITIGRQGKKPVDIKLIKPNVFGFSDDGNCLKNLKILEEALSHNILIMAYLEPEIEMAKKYIEVFKKVGKGILYFQHVSKFETVELVRYAKKCNLNIYTETCPQYFAFNNKLENLKINPPYGDEQDNRAILGGLKDGTIDVIASDFAPTPRPKKLALHLI